MAIPELASAAAVQPPKDSFLGSEGGLLGSDVSLSFVQTSSPDRQEGLAMLSYARKGVVTAHCFEYDRKGKNIWIKEKMKLFFEVLLLLKNPGSFIPSLGIKSHFDRMYRLRNEWEALQDCLAKEARVKEMKDSSKSCPVCGKTFRWATLNEQNLFRKHRENHVFLDFKCDCEVTWNSDNGKKNHVMLVHMNENNTYSKCGQCSFVGKHRSVETHVRLVHERNTCEFCGAAASGQEHLRQHIVSKHPEKLTGKMKRRKGESGTCKECGKFFYELKSHVQLKHRRKESCTCHICGREFTLQGSFRLHMLNAHTPREELKFGCDTCGKRLAKPERVFTCGEAVRS